ncbi:MAG: hypothetical protein A3H35_00840 [Betaproteobacteria bacterium RIFCSPLOWO2_02_FULL_62_17]|nr:MAG: hypothetical protein A3H35_00840 [Betaproteobacteria bacterium RIFCSPLOWO2_02_FULL_62_17]
MMTTVCTSCNTEFHVTWEQLKVRAGRVRCGQCHTVFNALVSLNRHRGETARTPDEIAPAGQPVPDSAHAAPHAQPAADSSLSWPPLNLGEDSQPHLASPLHEADPQPLSASEQRPALAPTPLTTAERKDLESAQAADSSSTSPVFEFGPKPSVKRGWWWMPLAMLLLLVLLGQTLFYFRGAIALLLPEAKPYISELCLELGCEVPLPRRVELVSIETSDLQADPTNPGVMVLSATLRNRAAFPQAFPALELTLTNDRDLPLARRVLQSSDYLTDKAEAFKGSSEKQIRLPVEAGALKASGYRLYLFYP